MSDDEALTNPWAVVEVLGHRTYVGQVEPVEVLGVEMLRVHVPERVDRHERRDHDGRRVQTITVTHPAFIVDIARHALFTVGHCTEAVALANLCRSERGPEDPVELLGEWRDPPVIGTDTDDIPF